MIVADILKSRLDLAVKMGADVTVNTKEEDLGVRISELTENRGVARVVEASGALINQMFHLVRKV